MRTAQQKATHARVLATHLADRNARSTTVREAAAFLRQHDGANFQAAWTNGQPDATAQAAMRAALVAFARRQDALAAKHGKVR